MPGFSIWQVFQVFGIVSAWSIKALEDGKITLAEAAQLAIQLAALLGIPTEINLPQEEGDTVTPEGTLTARAEIPDEEPHPKQVVT